MTCSLPKRPLDRRRALLQTVAATALTGAPGLGALRRATAQSGDWPGQKPIQMLVGFAPGSSTDIVARLVQSRLAPALGQSVVVENRGGAGGNIAAQAVKRAAPDGYTLLATSVAFAVNPSLYANAGYDALKDFAAVALLASTPNIITVNPGVNANTLKELIELARRQPLAYASSGIGTTTHLSVERLKAAHKLDIVHAPHQPAQAVLAAVSGATPMASTSLPPAVPHVKSGKLRALAVTSAQRSPALPEVPTINELGLGQFDDLTWFGVFAPAGTPEAVVNRLNAEIMKALEAPEVREKMGTLGFDVSRGTAAEFAGFVRSEVPKWAQAIRDSGAKAE